ncbi:MAG: response regulator [Fibrobacterales bacterium]
MKEILLIDDEELIRESLSELLEQRGYTVTAVETAEEGMSLCESRQYGCIISDIFMPEINGFEFIRHLKKKYPRSQVIAISGGSNKYGFGDFDYLDHIKSFGVDYAFYKPVDTEKLIEAIEVLLHQNCLSPLDVANIT